MSPMRTAPGRAGRTCCRGSAPADPPRRSAARAGLEGEGGRAQQETPRARSDAARAETTATCFDSGGGAAAATAGVRGGGVQARALHESRARGRQSLSTSLLQYRERRDKKWMDVIKKMNGMIDIGGIRHGVGGGGGGGQLPKSPVAMDTPPGSEA